MKKIRSTWWQPKAKSFFGNFYIEGDDSNCGYLDHCVLDLEERTEREVAGVDACLRASGALGLEPGLKLLDAPCGYGRHLRKFADLGLACTGIDVNPVMIARAQHNCHPDVELVQGELIGLPFNDAQFDICTNMFFSMGFYEDDENNFRCFHEISRCLKPGGFFVYHTDSILESLVAGTYTQPDVRQLQNGKLLRIWEQYDHDTKRLNGSWEIGGYVDGKNIGDRRYFSMRLFALEELRDVLESASMEITGTFESFDATPLDTIENAPELIMIARRR